MSGSVSMPRTTARELLRVVFVYKHLVLGVAMLFAAVAASAAYWSPDQYEASARLWIRDETATLRSVGESPREQYERIQVAAANLREAMLSRSVLRGVLEEVAGRRFERADPARQEAMVKKLRRRIRFDMARSSEFGASQVISVHVRDESRSRARQTLELLLAHTEQLLQQVGRERARQLVEKTERDWMQAREELRAVQRALQQLVAELGTGLLDVQAMSGSPVGDSDRRQRLAQLQRQLSELQARLIQRQNLLEAVRSGEVPEELAAELAELMGERTEGFARIRQALLEARVQQSVLQANMTDAHPELQTARERVAELEGLYRNEIGQLQQALQQQVAVLRRTVQQLRAKRDEAAAELARIAGRYPEFLALRTEYAIREEALRQAALKREQARMQLAIASQSAVFVPLDPLHVSTEPVTLPDIATTMAGGLLGLLCGVGLAFVANHYSHTVRDAGDLYRWGIDVPVLASVPAVDDPLLIEGHRKIASSRIASSDRVSR